MTPSLSDLPADEPRPELALFELALFELGRLDGALAYADPSTVALFAARVLRTLLIRALRQERLAFTNERFDAWFAGLVPLTDVQVSSDAVLPDRPPRLIVEALLGECAHASWAPLAEQAQRLRRAFLAPREDQPAARDEIECLLQDSRARVEALVGALAEMGDTRPLMGLERLHQDLAASPTFAPAEASRERILLGRGAAGERGPTARGLTIERAASPAPFWAIEVFLGGYLHATGCLRVPLPCPGLVRSEAIGRAAAPGVIAEALGATMRGWNETLAQAAGDVRRIATLVPDHRRSSRAPALCRLLAGTGALRSAQIEPLLDVTRLGLRTILGPLLAHGTITRQRVAGVWLYALAPAPVSVSAKGRDERAGGTGFSVEAVAAYEASLADIDALLARLGVDGEDDQVSPPPDC